MTGKEYQELAMRTNDGKCEERLQSKIDNNMTVDISEVICACLGLSGEVGELVDMVKKFVFHKTPMDNSHFIKEIGDIMWYIALLCNACDYNLDDILEMNIDKLKKRYPDGFDTYRANHREEGDV